MHTVGRSVAAIGFNVETIEYRNAEICIWDVGGESACLPACLPVWRLASNPFSFQPESRSRENVLT